MLAFQLDDLRAKFAEGNSKRYSKKDLLYDTIQLFFHHKTYIMIIFPPLVSCKARNLYNILSYKEKTNGFFKNKECIGNNKWRVRIIKGNNISSITKGGAKKRFFYLTNECGGDGFYLFYYYHNIYILNWYI